MPRQGTYLLPGLESPDRSGVIEALRSNPRLEVRPGGVISFCTTRGGDVLPGDDRTWREDALSYEGVFTTPLEVGYDCAWVVEVTCYDAHADPVRPDPIVVAEVLGRAAPGSFVDEVPEPEGRS